jgi:N-acyl-D-aspartate/D-glutamate deacylase
MLDVLIEGATVVDGTGGDAVVMPVGLEDGRLKLGDELRGAAARRHVDGSGLVLCPGFIDVHTHYDAQVFWDPFLTPSSLHGVTTVVAGNCGFSIAPLAAADADYMMRLLARVEGIPLEALEEGVPWNWSTFGEYLHSVDQVRPALNFGAMVGHSALRRNVLGSDSGLGTLPPASLASLRRALHEALEAGAMGFSSSWGDAHFDGNGDPVPSRNATVDELLGLCAELADFPGTQLEFIPTMLPFSDAHIELMTKMSVTARSPLNWNVLLPIDREETAGKLSASDHAAANGGRVVALSYPGPMVARVSLLSSAFDAIPGWSETMALPPDEIVRRLNDPAERERLRELATHGDTATIGLTRFENLRVLDTYTEETRPMEGRLLGDLARERGGEPFDILCELATADIRTGFHRAPIGDDAVSWELRLDTWDDPRVVLGASDAGAHVDMLSMFDYPVALMAMARERSELPLPQLIRSLTDVPAALYGMMEMGRIQEGYHADVVLFDPDAIAPGRVSWQDDLPGGAGRLFSEPVGVEHIFVNGTEIASGGKLTGEQPGRVLRAGKDTGTNF